MPPLSPRRRLIAAFARAFLPVVGPLVARRLLNFAALETTWPSFNELDKRARFLILSPHPDDETLGAGGLIARARSRGIAVKIVFATNGDGSRTTQWVLNAKRWREPNQTLFQIAQGRQLEALRAAQILGVDEEHVSFLGFPDGALGAILSAKTPFRASSTKENRVPYERAARPNAPYTRDSFVDVLQGEIESFQPTLVLTTHPRDTHPDHSAAFEALQIVRRRMNAAPQLATFLIHYGIWPVPNGLHRDLPLAPPAELLKENWRTLGLSPDEIETKRRALGCHASQLASTPRYLHAFVRRNELFTAPTSL